LTPHLKSAHESCFLFLLLASCISSAAAAVICQRNVTSCVLYLNDAGSLVDRSTGHPIAKIGGLGAFSNTSVYKYGNQYAVVQENSSNDRLVTVIPLVRKNKEWISSSFYYFSISLVASSAKSKPLWLGSKIATQETKVGDDILERAGDLPSRQGHYTYVPSGWPSKNLYVATSARQSKGGRCFVPFDSQDGPIPIGFLACSSLKNPIRNGYHDFSGVIGNDIFIDVSLKKIGHNFSGNYRYLRDPNKLIRVEGTLSKDGSFSMREFSESGEAVFGDFRGSTAKGIISGKWKASDKSRSLPFSLYAQGFP
jgi:hypothetical protein